MQVTRAVRLAVGLRDGFDQPVKPQQTGCGRDLKLTLSYFLATAAKALAAGAVLEGFSADLARQRPRPLGQNWVCTQGRSDSRVRRNGSDGDDKEACGADQPAQPGERKAGFSGGFKTSAAARVDWGLLWVFRCVHTVIIGIGLTG